MGQITHRDVGNDGHCKIKFDEHDHDILFKPNATHCPDTVGIVEYDQFVSDCNALINQEGNIDNIVFITNQSTNSSFIYIGNTLVHSIPYNIQSSFGFFCENAVGLINSFIFKIDNGENQIFPLDASTLSSTENDKKNAESVDSSILFIIIGGIILMAILLSCWIMMGMRIRKKRARKKEEMEREIKHKKDKKETKKKETKDTSSTTKKDKVPEIHSEGTATEETPKKRVSVTPYPSFTNIAVKSNESSNNNKDKSEIQVMSPDCFPDTMDTVNSVETMQSDNEQPQIEIKVSSPETPLLIAGHNDDKTNVHGLYKMAAMESN